MYMLIHFFRNFLNAFHKHDINNYNPGHKGLNCAIPSCHTHHIFFQFVEKKRKRKNKKTNCYFLSFTHEATFTNDFA